LHAYFAAPSSIEGPSDKTLFERRQKSPSLATLQKLAHALHVTVDDLLPAEHA
jgi:hypothetical protein